MCGILFRLDSPTKEVLFSPPPLPALSAGGLFFCRISKKKKKGASAKCGGRIHVGADPGIFGSLFRLKAFLHFCLFLRESG